MYIKTLFVQNAKWIQLKQIGLNANNVMITMFVYIVTVEEHIISLINFKF